LLKERTHRNFEWLKSVFKCGYIRHRPTGISDYTIVELAKVKEIPILLKPYVRLKQRQVNLGIKIIDELNTVKCPEDFLKVCRMVDYFGELNYSKKRKITSQDVKRFLEVHNYLAPVETDSVKDESHLL